MQGGAKLSKFVCQQNIQRYERMLKTYLTDVEREFVERRLTEEKHALQSSEAETLLSVTGVVAFLLKPLEVVLPSVNLIEQVILV